MTLGLSLCPPQCCEKPIAPKCRNFLVSGDTITALVIVILAGLVLGEVFPTGCLGAYTAEIAWSGIAFSVLILAIDGGVLLYFNNNQKALEPALPPVTQEAPQSLPAQTIHPHQPPQDPWQKRKEQILGTPQFTLKDPGAKLPSSAVPYHQIFEGLYLGNFRTVANLLPDPPFQKVAFSTVITLCPISDISTSVPAAHLLDANQIWIRFETEKVKWIHLGEGLHDRPEAWATLEKSFKDLFPEMDEALAGRKNVLVHCFAGRSRSVATIAAYLIHRTGATPQEVVNYLCSIRDCINPEIFMPHLELYHKKVVRK